MMEVRGGGGERGVGIPFVRMGFWRAIVGVRG